jgi:hypothetical protein
MRNHSPHRQSSRPMCPRSAVSGRINASRGRIPTVILEVRLSACPGVYGGLEDRTLFPTACCLRGSRNLRPPGWVYPGATAKD